MGVYGKIDVYAVCFVPQCIVFTYRPRIRRAMPLPALHRTSPYSVVVAAAGPSRINGSPIYLMRRDKRLQLVCIYLNITQKQILQSFHIYLQYVHLSCSIKVAWYILYIVHVLFQTRFLGLIIVSHLRRCWLSLACLQVV